MFNLFKQRSAIFGLDIGFETLKLVELKRKGGKASLRGAISVPLTERIIEKDHFKDKAQAAKMIQEARDKARPSAIKSSGIVTALPETFVFSKTIQVPKMPESEYSEALGQEVAQYLPLPLEEVYIDFQTLIVHPDEPLIDVLFVAAPKRLVDDYVEVANLAGCELVALETKPLAVGRALIARKSTEGLLIIEIGTEISRISIWDGYKIRLSTTVSVGKNQLSKSSADVTEEKTAGISAFQRETIAPLIEEAVNAVRYHQNRDYQPKPVTKILVCGSGANIPGLVDHLNEMTKIKTEIAKPALSSGELSTDFTTSYGLALWDE